MHEIELRRNGQPLRFFGRTVAFSSFTSLEADHTVAIHESNDGSYVLEIVHEFLNGIKIAVGEVFLDLDSAIDHVEARYPWADELLALSPVDLE